MTIYFFVIFFVTVLDQFSKLWILDFLSVYKSRPIIPGFLNFSYLENTGMSFGWLSADNERWIFMTLSTIGIIAMVAYLIYINKTTNDKLMCFALALVVGGGIGNMFDRISLGYVIDFIDVCCFDFWAWTFNVADSAVCVGAGLLILALLREYLQERKQK